MRDERIDLLRGVGLINMLWSHSLVLGHIYVLIFYMNPSYVGISDGADIFVFLSGWLVGSVYLRAHDQGGLRLTLPKALRRVVQLYGTHLLCIAGISLILHASRMMGWPLLREAHELLVLSPSRCKDILLLRYLPPGADILPLYMVLLLGIPFLLALYRRSPIMAVGLSVGLWVVPFIFPDFNPSRYLSLGSDGVWFFYPLSWQLLFFLGVICQDNQHHLDLSKRWHNHLMLTSLGFVMIVPVIRLTQGIIHSPTASQDLEFYQYLMHTELFGGDKRTQGPVRILNFLAIMLIVKGLWPDRHQLKRTTVTRLLSLPGRYPLPIYVVSTLGSYAVGAHTMYHGNPIVFWIEVMSVWVLCLGIAYTREKWEERTRIVTTTATVPTRS